MIAFLCFSVGANAQNNAAPPVPNDSFKSWQSMLDYLASEGIDAAKINWAQIDSLCLGLKTDSGEPAYNKCSHDKGRDFVLFTADRAQCFTQAAGLFPDSFLRARTDTLTETDKNGSVHTFQRSTAALSPPDLAQQRDAAVVSCMQRLSWVDANDWRPGKRSSYCQ